MPNCIAIDVHTRYFDGRVLRNAQETGLEVSFSKKKKHWNILKLFYNVKYCKQKSVTNDPIAETLETDMIKCLEHDIVTYRIEIPG
jgi:hypothetical protein